jgi:PTS system nitrogen regulatory IIA component
MRRPPVRAAPAPPPLDAGSDQLLTIKELAAHLRLNERTVLKLAGEGALPGVRVGNQWRFRRRIIDAWLDDQTVGFSPNRIPPRDANEAAPRTFALCDCLAPEQIVTALEATTAMGVVEQLATHAERLGLVRDRTWFTGALIERENMLSTAVGHGVAFPHTVRRHPEQVTRPFVLVGRSLSGIDFHAPDGAPVYLFFVLGLRYDELHLPWLAKLSHLLSSSGLLEALLEAPDAATLYARLVAAESAGAVPKS